MRILLAAIGLGAIGVGGFAVSAGTDADPATDAPPPISVDQVAPGEREDTPSALENPRDDRLPPPIIDIAQLRSGGPPPDGIPAIDEPRFLDAGGVDFLADNEPVLALEIDGDARSYPLQIMTWHEIVNDTVGDVPVAVTYCPLCNTAIAFDRRLDDCVLSFGTSGLLFNSALVMYDRQTESLWSHFTSEALAGVLTGERLETYPVSIVSWAEWREAHPDGLVLSRETGHVRSYGVNPYPGYDNVDSPPFLFDGEVDGRLAAKERIIGVGLDSEPVAVLLSALSEEGVLDVEVDGVPLTVWHVPGTSSALDAAAVAGGRDVGATGVFIPEVGGEQLTFERVDDHFVDDETGSEWDIFGKAIGGPLEGERLEQVEHVDTFWFAWAAYQPETTILPED